MDTSKLVGTLVMFASLAYIFLALKYCDCVYSRVLSNHPELTPDNTTASARLGLALNLGVFAMVSDDGFLPSAASEATKALVARAQAVYWSCVLAFLAFIIGMLIA